MRVRILSFAEAELHEAVEYHNHQSPGLGYELAAEVKAAFDRIASFPTAWPVFSERSRRCLVNRFPYGVLYQVRGDTVLVVAIMHLRRAPTLWGERAASPTPE